MLTGAGGSWFNEDAMCMISMNLDKTLPGATSFRGRAHSTPGRVLCAFMGDVCIK